MEISPGVVSSPGEQRWAQGQAVRLDAGVADTTESLRWGKGSKPSSGDPPERQRAPRAWDPPEQTREIWKGCRGEGSRAGGRVRVGEAEGRGEHSRQVGAAAGGPRVSGAALSSQGCRAGRAGLGSDVTQARVWSWLAAGVRRARSQGGSA